MEAVKKKRLPEELFRRGKDIVLLNFLWLLGSLPVVTAGASTTAVCTVYFKWFQEKNPDTARCFWEAWRENLVQAIRIWIADLIIGGCFVWGIVRFINGASLSILLIGFGLLAILLYIIHVSYVFPLLARYENTVGQTVKNSLLIGFRYCYRTFQILVLLGITVAAGILLRHAGWLLLFFAPGLLLFLEARLFFRIFLYLEEESERKKSDL